MVISLSRVWRKKEGVQKKQICKWIHKKEKEKKGRSETPTRQLGQYYLWRVWFEERRNEGNRKEYSFFLNIKKRNEIHCIPADSLV